MIPFNVNKNRFLLIALMAFTFLPTGLLAQQKNATGRVINAHTRESAAGASIRVQSSGAKTKTDSAGIFSIPAMEGDVLEITSVGYAPKYAQWKGEDMLTVELQSDAKDLGEVVMIGNRSKEGRIITETPVPVDIINVSKAKETTAKTDVTSLLNMTAPSFNYNKQSGSDGADAIDLASLRGLSPDQTLVLVNGKRRHQTAFVSVFGTRGRGASGTDLNAIPEASIDRVEILRDGASAQYGSDAIAGVINIILRKNINKLEVNLGWAGYYDDKFNAGRSVVKDHYVTGTAIDGNTEKVGLNYGFPIGKQNGFINLSANFLLQSKTFRQAPDTNLGANPEALPINTNRRALGDGSIAAAGGMINAEIPIARTKTTFYAFGGYNYKASEVYAYSRNFYKTDDRAKYPTDANGNLLFVDGIMRYGIPGDTNSVFYDPLIQANITDASGALGFRGTFTDGWNWDISNTLGYNNFHYFGEKTFNSSLGANGINKNSFDDGGFYFLQNTFNAGMNKRLSHIAEGMNLSFGIEGRYERYSIYRGEEASYKNYDFSKSSGAQGFSGFQPLDEVAADRFNLAAYVDQELDITKRWLLALAGRFEYYTDFSALATLKVATRYKLAPNFNVRASASTGFRAPSLQQINFSNTFITSEGGKIFQIKIASNDNPITKAAGIMALRPETAINAGAGFTWKPASAFTITVDAYFVNIKDRIVLSGKFDTNIRSIAATLNQLNVSKAQFYANAVNTTNYGVDVVLNYTRSWGNHRGKAVFAGNWQQMTIDDINIPNALNGTEVDRQSFYSEREQTYLLASAPNIKANLNLEYGYKKFTVGTYLTLYGPIDILGYEEKVNLDATGETVREEFKYGAKLVWDAYFSYQFSKAFSLFLGCDNILNIHPDYGVVSGARKSAYDSEAGGAWDPVQMGYNGRRFFAKVTIRL